MKAVSVILFIVGMVTVALLSTAIVSWLVMLLIGMMYHTFDWPARAYGLYGVGANRVCSIVATWRDAQCI